MYHTHERNERDAVAGEPCALKGACTVRRGVHGKGLSQRRYLAGYLLYEKVTEEECGDCYALRWAKRHGMDVWGGLYSSNRHLTKTHENPRRWNKEAQAQGKRIKVFCASLSDVFEPHPQVAEARKRLWALIEETPYLDWQLLTKRPKFITRLIPASWLSSWPTHVWIGTSVGTQAAVEKRLPYLLNVPARVRFLSCEPLVEPVTLAPWLAQHRGITWVIVGGYSGSQHRPMDLAWARSLRDECQQFEVAFFMKQLGSVYAREHHLADWKGEDIREFPEDLRVRQFPDEFFWFNLSQGERSMIT